MERVWVVVGVNRDFDGHAWKFPVCVCREESKAREKGALWVREQNDYNKSTGQLLHASYEMSWFQVI